MPLTPLGMKDREKVSEALEKYTIDKFISSPYKRSVDTIADCAKRLEMEIYVDERFRERKQGEMLQGIVEKLWNDFDYCDKGWESNNAVQARNIEALTEVLQFHPNKNIVIGTHGAALSTMLNHYDPSFSCEAFYNIRASMPYIIKCEFDNQALMSREELLKIDRGY